MTQVPTPIPTLAEVLAIYDKYNLRWMEGEYIAEPTTGTYCACLAGAFLVDAVASCDEAWDCDESEAVGTISEHYGWSYDVIASFTRGNDGLVLHRSAQILDHPNRPLLIAAHELGVAVRQHFTEPTDVDE